MNEDFNETRKGLYGLSDNETDTYQSANLEEKMVTSQEEIAEHWRKRAERPGLQSVMSARYTPKQNEQATVEIKKEIFSFLEGRIGKESVVFELGTGIGRMTSELANRVKSVVSIDMTQEMIDKAKENLRDFDNIDFRVGKVKDFNFPEHSFDLAIETIVLLHILNPQELKDTIDGLKKLSKRILIVEHTYQDADFPSSRYTILRTPEKFEELFKPFRLESQRQFYCGNDLHTLMYFLED